MPLDRQPTLVGDGISLRPLRADDFDALYAIAADPLLWEQHPAKERATESGFRRWMAEAVASGGALTALDDAGRIVGTSRFDQHEGEVEIGWTFVARNLWGSGTNGEMKRLMLRHAFATVGAVVFRVHNENFRSQRAVEKLGAVRIGTQTSTHGHGTNLVFRLVNPASVERDLAAYYDQEAEERAGRDLNAQRVAARTAFLATLPPSAPILEVGIGTGRDARAFVAADHLVVGTDLSARFAAHAAATGAQVLLGTARSLPFRDASFGVLWSMSALMHIPNSAIEGALGELRRVLSPGGVAAIGVWGGADAEDYLENATYRPPRLFSRRSDARWQAMLGSLGRVDHFERWDDAGDPFWYQYAVVRRV